MDVPIFFSTISTKGIPQQECIIENSERVTRVADMVPFAFSVSFLLAK